MLSNLRLEDMSSDLAGLAWKFQVNPESCDNPAHYENYIRLTAIYDNDAGMGKTLVLVGDESDLECESVIAGYITLKASSLITAYIDGARIGEPAVEVSELAVNKVYEHQGIGTQLVQYAIVTAQNLNKQFLGVKYIVLCADPKAVGFYKTFEFAELDDYSEIPREPWNRNCTPMCIRLH